jgi:hypothetical protein
VPPPPLANVVLAIVDQLDLEALPVSMDTMVTKDSQVNPEIAAHQLDQHPNLFQNHQNNAHAKLHQETEVPQDQKELMDHPVMEVPQALMANQAIKDHVDPPAHQAQLEDPETKAHQVKLVNSQAPKLVHPVHLAPPANPVEQALLPNLARLVKMVPQAKKALQEMQALQVVLARTALPAVPAKQANLVHLAVAITAHQPVWLQVIKHWRQEQLVNNNNCQNHHINFHCENQQIAKTRPSLNIYYCLLFVLTQTFHVKKALPLSKP